MKGIRQQLLYVRLLKKLHECTIQRYVYYTPVGNARHSHASKERRTMHFIEALTVIVLN